MEELKISNSGECVSVERMESSGLPEAAKCEFAFIPTATSEKSEAGSLVLINKAYKYRLYPNKEQRKFLNQTMGCCRWLWNHAVKQFKELDEKNKDLEKEQKIKLSIQDISKQIPLLKKENETSFLKSAISISLIQTLRNLDTARSNYFRNLKNGKISKMKSDYVNHKKKTGGEINKQKLYDLGKPRFKSKGHRQSCSFHQAYSIDFTKSVINISKCPGVKVVFHKRKKDGIELPLPFEGKTKTVTIEKTPSGKYFASILVEEKMFIPHKKEITEDTTLGLHNGISVVATSDNNEVIDRQSRFLRSKLKHLKVLQKRLSRKEKGSKRWDLQRLRVAKLYEHITNQRNYMLHEISNEIIRNPNYNTIALENWDKLAMMKNPIFAQYIADVSWERLIQFIKYKAVWNGKNILELAPVTPNAKTCNDCEHVNEWVELRHRNWKCENCGAEHNREENSSKNTKKMTIKNLKTSKLS